MHGSMIRNGSIYTQTARFDGHARALTEDEMRRQAPSIFATEAHGSRSDRFAPIPTIDVLRGLAAEGFSVVGVKQSSARSDDKADYTKHLVRLRKLDGAAHQVGGSVFEMLLKNANDGTAAYDLMGGMFRICCLNSLVVPTSTIDSVKVRHSGDAIGKVIEGTFRVLGNAEAALAAPQDWSKVTMGRDAQMALAEGAHLLRFGDAEGETHTPVQPAQLLTPRRREDAAADLWTVFNRVQENAIKGGLRGRHDDTVDEYGRRVRGRRVTTREVQGIDQDVRLNRALWTLSERMAQILKQAA